MAKYANQKTYLIHRNNPINQGEVYLAIKASSIAAAAKLLSASGFKLYLYLATNKDGFKLDYSPKHFAELYGVSYESARKNAKQDLIDNGFLVQNNNGGYDFYEEPQEHSHFTIQIERRLLPTDTGELKPVSLQDFLNDIGGQATTEQATEYWYKWEVAANE